MSSRSDKHLTRRILKEARPYRSRLAVLFALGLAETPALLLLPVPVKIVVDSVLGDDPLPAPLGSMLPDSLTRTGFRLLVVAAVLQVLVVVLLHLQQIAAQVLRRQIGEGLTLRFRSKLFAHLQRLSLSFHDTRGTADSIYRIQYDAPAIQSYVVEGLLPLAAATVALVSLIGVTARINGSLALVALAVSPFLYLLASMSKRRLRVRHRHTKVLESSAFKVVQEVMTGLRVVKAFGREEAEEERFAVMAREGARSRVRLVVAEGLVDMAVSLLTAAGTAVVLFVGVRSVQTGALTLGELLMVLAYLGQLYTPLKTISRKVVHFQSDLAGAERAFDVLDRFPDVGDRAGAAPIARSSGAIELRDVSFGYDGGPPVLRDLSLRIPAGTRLGVSGPTGAGKTTFASLLMRLYDPSRGRILLDGGDLRNYALEDLRRQFAVVLQEPLLFSASVRENIAYGRPDAADDEIILAAKQAAAHGFILELPDGYETLVGERGMRLSGGERQRISIARAFLRDAPILILDEPTSSVDRATEALIVDAMHRLMVGRTTILISHRPDALIRCDARIEIRRGRAEALLRPAARHVDSAFGDDRAPVRQMRFVAEPAVNLDHEAIRAWRRLGSNAPLPESVETLIVPKEKRAKSSIYRLRFDGDGGSVIAKRERRNIVGLERLIYSRVLPFLPLTSIRFLGSFGEGDHGWIFLEDAGGVQLSEADPVHRSIAAAWMGQMHTASSARPELASGLPDHGPDRYLEHLRRARGTISDNLTNPAISAEDADMLHAVLRQCDELASSWSDLSSFCNAVPRCLVHGDFAAKNARVRSDGGDIALLVMDWEMAGWGTPAADIMRLDPVAYHSATQAVWPHLELDDVLELSRIGTIFRALAAIDWDSRMLRFPWVEHALANIRGYERWLYLARNGTPYRLGAASL